TYEGANRAVGFFKNGQPHVGIDRGLVMTTGSAVTQGGDVGVESNGGTQAAVDNSDATQDPDLAAIAGGNSTNDMAKYTITFIPISDTLRFRYAFGSEEYPEYACSAFNDIFGFFISGPGINGPYENNGVNIALIPGTNLPVRINNINSGQVGAAGSLNNCTPPAGSLAFSQFYNDNLNSSVQPVYDGFTDVFTAEAIVIPCNVYTIKLLICDVSDGSHDSGVFLEAKSFGTGSLDVKATTVSLDGSVAEGCTDGTLTFSLPTEVESDFPIDFNVLGTATNGVDYELIPDDLFIPAGSSSVSIPITAIEDALTEGTETIILDIRKDVCTRDTIIIPLRDNPLVPADLGLDQRFCEDNSIQLDGTLPVPLPTPPAFTNSNNLPISQTNVSYFSDIQVFGVIPPILGPGVIKSVCIDSLSHRWIDDMDIYLVGPDGQFFELTTDNGGNGNNGGGQDYYIDACFMENAIVPINFPGPFAPPTAVPFTGNWQPEGVWSDLWDGNNKKTNGTWRLQVIDDANGFTGTLHSWTICFNPAYEINYSWSPQAGLSCADCPNPVAMPDQTTTYFMTATDSYGCTVSDSIVLEIIPVLDAPLATCGTITESSVSAFWPEVEAATGYEVSINNGPWMPSSDLLSHTITGLSLSQSVDIAVRAIGECPGAETSLTCMTPDCTPPVLTINQVSDATCNGASDGTTMVSAAGGLGGPFTYELDGVTNLTGAFNGLSAGSYVALATDVSGCTGSIQLIVGEPQPLDVQMVQTSQISCNGQSNGAAEAIVNGGTIPFSFVWDNGDADATADGLGAGDHNVVITDGNGCVTTRSITLIEPAALGVQTTTQLVSCFGGMDGIAIATASGGTLPYEYFWDALAANQRTDTAFQLVAGSYTITVTDLNGCSVAASADVTQNSEIVLSAQSQDATCNGLPDGTASVAATGGSGNYSYTWTDVASGMLVGASDLVSQLFEGSYFVIVEDEFTCRDTAQVSISAPAALDVQFVTQAPLCTNAANGTATLTTSGGTPGYQFTWSDNGAAISPLRNDLAAGSYTVTITDANSCATEISFDLTDPLPVLLQLSTTQASCFGGNDGTATVVASGGAGGYTYAWPSGQNGATATGLSAGPVSVTVADANGCQAVGNILVGQEDALQVVLTPANLTCFNNNSGMVTASTSGGAGNYTYQWSNGAQGPMVANLAAGNIGVTVTDGNGCQTTSAASISQPTPVTASIASSLVSCLGQPDGTATVTPSGGTSPYTYTWSDPAAQQTPVATGLNTGNFSVTVADANNCTFVTSVDVGGTPPISLSVTPSDVRCYDGNDGSIQVVATGGNGNFVYSWNTPDIPQTGSPGGLRAGQYAVTVTDSGGCTATASASIAQPTALVAQASGTNLVCADDGTGTTQSQVSGGTPPYNYLWNTGIAAPNLANLQAGVYRLSVTDANGCLAIAETMLAEPAALEVEIDPVSVDCYGGSTGAVTSSVEGGVQPYTYTWSNGASTQSLEGIPAGVYELAITDASGCRIVESTQVLQPEAALTASFSSKPVTCFGEEDGSIVALTTGGTPAYRYSLDGHDFRGSSTLIGLEAGTYNVYVLDAKGCLFVQQGINIDEPEALEVDLGDDVTLDYGLEVRLEPQITGGSGVLTYSWYPEDTTQLSCLDCATPSASVPYQTSFTLRVTDENGCYGEDIITVFVRKSNPVFVPTGFTPNGNSNNDRLLVHGKAGIQVQRFTIYDRWGEMLFEAQDFEVNDPLIGWDGSYRGKPMNSGVYIWRLEVVFEDGNHEVYTGSTTLIR
ncbi:MAG: gliding motility-associated C-terminal domain-containing protein, partial [Saprospiraceae bacterium]|nr:gliding motility-associated C-terminal domain-containing protein [Saprospiraceae bacterium]